MSLLKFPLSYCQDSSSLFALIANEPWAVFLDSGRPVSQYGRYDIMVCDPFCTLVTQGEVTTIADSAGERVSNADPFEVLKAQLAPYSHASAEVPFFGGAIGYFAYDLARRIAPFSDEHSKVEAMPQMMIGLYDWAVVVDHKAREAYLVSYGLHPDTHAKWAMLCDKFSPKASVATHAAPFKVHTDVVSNMSENTYSKAFHQVKDYIAEGDCYQVNLAQRFSVQASGDGWQAYEYLRKISPAPFMAYMRYPNLEVISGSPERFVQTKGKHVETRPIKGTRPRSSNPIQDQNNATELQQSLKDRAENLMIVDLLRNDISKNCEIGSVKVNKLFALESFANVHHLVSTIVGQLATDKTAIDLLKGCFPGGSITGAPKLRSMQIIDELEPNQRGIYCGAIGYIGFDGNMDTNIAIRTAVYSNGEFRFWAGGGVVADSEVQKEYKETWDKASSMLALIKFWRGQD
jgi:para-aminobenzoate synthetase component I